MSDITRGGGWGKVAVCSVLGGGNDSVVVAIIPRKHCVRTR